MLRYYQIYDDCEGRFVPRGTAETGTRDDAVAIYCLDCVARVCDVFSVLAITIPKILVLICVFFDCPRLLEFIPKQISNCTLFNALCRV